MRCEVGGNTFLSKRESDEILAGMLLTRSGQFQQCEQISRRDQAKLFTPHHTEMSANKFLDIIAVNTRLARGVTTK